MATSNRVKKSLVLTLVTALGVILAVPALAQQPQSVFCDDCAKLAREALASCTGPRPLCEALARAVRDNCEAVCVNRPVQTVCPAANVQHWNKIVVHVPKNRRIERDGSLAGTTDSFGEVIVRSVPNEFLDPFVAVKQTIELRPFCVVLIDANGLDIDRHSNELFRSDLDIVSIAYSTICAEERPPTQSTPDSTGDKK